MVSYFNGGDALRSGILFTSGAELLTKLSQALTQENWTILDDQISSSNLILMQGSTVNNHNCYVIASTDSGKFRIQGDLDGSGNDISPILDLDFDDGENNRFWLTCDRDSGGFCIKSKFFYSGSLTFGFLDRFDINDQGGWMITRGNNKLNDALVARSAHNGEIWHRIGDAFVDADVITSNFFNGAMQGILDLQVVVNAYLTYANTNIRNAAYRAELGALTLDDLLIFTQRFYLEGRGTNDNYISINDLPSLLYLRGFIKHLFNGTGGAPGGQTEKLETGELVLSTGGAGGGWQGLIIDSETIPVDRLQVIFRPDAGASFLNPRNLYEEVINALFNAGWAIFKDNGARIIMRGQYFDTNNYCFLRVEAVNGEILIQGDATGNESNLSPAVKFTYTENVINRSWITTNKQSGTISFFNGGDADQGGAWFGFMKTTNPKWGVGAIHSDARLSYFLDNGVWRSFADNYVYAYDDFSSFPITTFDHHTVAGLPILNFDNDDDRNSARFAYKGALNGFNNIARLSYFGFKPGLSSSLSYGISAQGQGNAPKQDRFYQVYFVASGAASLTAGQIVTQNGKRYRSVGGEQWQAMRMR